MKRTEKAAHCMTMQSWVWTSWFSMLRCPSRNLSILFALCFESIGSPLDMYQKFSGMPLSSSTIMLSRWCNMSWFAIEPGVPILDKAKNDGKQLLKHTKSSLHILPYRLLRHCKVRSLVTFRTHDCLKKCSPLRIDALCMVVTHHVLTGIDNILARRSIYGNKPREQRWSRQHIQVVIRARQSKEWMPNPESLRCNNVQKWLLDHCSGLFIDIFTM